MKTIRALSFSLLLASPIWFAPAARPATRDDARDSSAVYGYHSAAYAETEAPLASDAGGGIREEIPDRYRARYEQWKADFLSTGVGRAQWAAYSRNPRFTLTINVSGDNRHGADTGRYRWNDAGELVAATITLGTEIDSEFPDPVYYPVMNSLGWSSELYEAGGDILAATKIAHEFGHVIRAANSDSKLYRLQNRLIPIYRSIFLKNGHDVNDPRLVDLARQMGGTSIEVWEDREYWGEANAMRYLRERASEKSFRCYLFSRIRRTVDEYAENYAGRFDEIARSKPTPCGWQ